jgi:hypothetical protein
MERFVRQTEAKLNSISIKINAEGHIARVDNALISAQSNLDLVIESILNAQKGILQPQIVSPCYISGIHIYIYIYRIRELNKAGYNIYE